MLHGLGKADNGVQRRAQFVAHVGQEFRLDAIGSFRGFLRYAAFDQRFSSRIRSTAPSRNILSARAN